MNKNLVVRIIGYTLVLVGVVGFHQFDGTENGSSASMLAIPAGILLAFLGFIFERNHTQETRETNLVFVGQLGMKYSLLFGAAAPLVLGAILYVLSGGSGLSGGVIFFYFITIPLGLCGWLISFILWKIGKRTIS